MTALAPDAPFWQSLSRADRPVLLLDYDGTLAPFRVERDQAVPYPGIRRLLDAIRRTTRTRLVIISGRAIDDLLPLLGLQPPPEIWGCHGWERLRADGRRTAVELPATARTGLVAAGHWLSEQGLAGHAEHKPASVALHWRGLDAAGQNRLRRLAEAGWQPLAERYLLQLHRFDGGLELRCPGRDKGSAIATILSESPADALAVFLGDDLTDEDGFRALEEHGAGILVRREPRPTAARYRLCPPEELVAFLQIWRERARPRNGEECGP
ncbi:MAG: trehalose-phosphatase [Desulfuromonadales bacterium]|nr:trehalose-phosphatase [Desulfuromonadales bacterium]